MRRAVLAVAVIAFAAGSLSAEVVYSASGTTPTGIGINSGASVGVAESFTPSQDYDLTTIQMPLAWFQGTNSATIALASGSGGRPGITLESWVVGSLPTFTGGVPSDQVVTDSLSIMLTSGTQYWIEVLAPAGPSGEEVYFDGGPGIQYWNAGAGWTEPIAGSFNAEVDGTVVPSATPEPGTLGLIGLAGLALAYLRRRTA